MENEELSVNVEVAEPQTDVESTSESEAVEETANVEVAKPQQSAEENARFAEMRRKQELDDFKAKYKEKDDAFNALQEKYNALENRANSFLSNYYDADSLEDKFIQGEAQIKGVTEDELREQMRIEQQAITEKEEMQKQLDYYKGISDKFEQMQAERMLEDDLKELQKIDPSIKSIEEMGDNFVNLRFTVNPLSGKNYTVEEIYNHIKSKIKPLPDTSPSVNTITADTTVGNKYATMSDSDFEKEYNRLIFG